MHHHNSIVHVTPKGGLDGLLPAKPSFCMTMTKILTPGFAWHVSYPSNEDDAERETGFGNMTPICWRKYNKAMDRGSLSSDYQTDLEDDGYEYYSISIQLEKERLGRPFFRQGKFYRSVSTSTSPERYGLVKSIGINTSPDLECRSPILPDVTQFGPSCPSQHHHGNACNVTEKEIQMGAREGSEILSGDHGNCMSRTTEIIETRVSLNSLNRDASSVGKMSDDDTEYLRRPHSSRSSAYSCLNKEGAETSVDTESDDSTNPTACKRRHRHYASVLRAQRHGVLERTRLKQQLSAARMLGIIMAFLLLCWLPFAILWPLRVFCPRCVSQGVYNLSIWINYANSGINPVIYFLSNPHCRKAFRNLLTQKWRH